MPLVILHHLLNVSVQLANERGLEKSLSHRHYTATASSTLQRAESPQQAPVHATRHEIQNVTLNEGIDIVHQNVCVLLYISCS
jgi:hypothetical protein